MHKDLPKTSTLSHVPSSQRNLTLHDWLYVVYWFNKNQPVTQEGTVKHFKTLHDEALVFTQASLSRHLTKKEHEQDQAKLIATPSALSSKHIHIVTRPDVEEALQLWVEHMESKRETMSQPMLIEKRAWFEDMLSVPESQRLQSNGWCQRFLLMWVEMLPTVFIDHDWLTLWPRYNLKDYWRHGEGASVNLKAVGREWSKVAKILNKYSPEDHLNMDESGLFGLWAFSVNCTEDFVMLPNSTALLQIEGYCQNRFWARNQTSFTLLSH